ncbi:nose resistant to fluoxetine protein 6-like, partial [Condylostylus longicornis]|uniref:nose resistant to fluoxetine protein 6-like n=1 Tax=Condylostylus longicornis TaxID=2530218 RepID=UPI00244DAA01
LKKSSIIFGLTKTVNEDYVSHICFNQLQEIKKAILRKDIWGIKVLDASGVKKPGFLWGNSFWFGSKEGCDAVQNPVYITLSDQLKRTMKMGLIGDLAPFAMEYRIVYIKHNSPWQVENKVQTEGIIHVGLCIPKSCSNNEIHNITQNYIEQDIYTETNLYEMNQDASAIPIINGIRSISCIWIICFHVAWYMWFTIDDQTFLVSNAEKIFYQYISTAPLLVDVFFTISGFLLAYKFIKNEKEMKIIAENNCKENFKILLDKIFHRYLRLAPPSFALIGIVEVFSAYSENVSIFHLHERNDETCSKYWWRNFLFIQNFYNLDDMCLNWSWSLACEMQFFILTLLLLFVYTKNQQRAKNIFIVSFITTIIWSFIAGFKYQYQLSFDIAYKTRTHIYINPFLRILPYYLGTGAGWYLATNKGEFEMTQKFEKRCWYISLVIFFVSIYSTIKRDIGYLPTIALMVIGRILFSLSVCWMIIGSATGHGVWWSRILECKLFQHLNKLSYCMYLINPLVIFIIFNLSNSTNHTDPIMMSVLTVGIIVIVYVLSIFFSISFEMPYCNFSTFLHKRNKKKIA